MIEIILENCKENFNMMYEWTCGNNEWYPCHVLTDKSKLNRPVVIYTRNGTITREPVCNVRKMSKETYIRKREEEFDYDGEYAYKWYGYHEDIEEDLKLFEQSNDLEMYI